MRKPLLFPRPILKISKRDKHPPPNVIYEGKYSLLMMAVGDSFAVPDGCHLDIRRHIHDLCGITSPYCDYRYSVLKLGYGNYRCWRVA